MSKKYFISLGLLGVTLSFILSSGLAMAEVQSPIYTDDIGRSHFLGRGGYSSVRKIQMDQVQADVVNDAANKFSQKETPVLKEEKTEKSITDVINEKQYVPASSYKSTFSSEKGSMDASGFYGYGGTNIPAGVNESKTIYTDDLGRLHFFGKANQFKD